MVTAIKQFLIGGIFVIAASCRSQEMDRQIVLVDVGNLTRTEIANQISIINSLKPRVIALDVQFKKRFHDEGDKKLFEALKNCKSLVMTSSINNLGGGVFVTSGSIWEFANLQTRQGFINTILEDNLLRKFLVWEDTDIGNQNKQFHFSVSIAMEYDSLKASHFVHNNPKVVSINFSGGNRRFVKISTNDVLFEKLSKRDIEGKIVIFGYLGPTEEDRFNTPVGKMYGVEYLAYVVAQILEYEH
jgi:CHASE2 domain-containing sensor protein